MQDRLQILKDIISNDIFKDELDNMKKELVNTIINSDDDQQAMRESSYVRIRAINDIVARLESIAMNDEIKDKSWKIL